MIRSATFVIPATHGRATTVARLVTPPAASAADFGTLMFLASLSGKLKMREQIMDNLVTSFFKTASEAREERIVLDDHFERVVRAVNDEIVRQVATHGKEWLQDLHLFVSILRPPELVFSLRGSLRPLLLVRERVYNLLELGNRVHEGPPNPFRFLATLMTGKLEEGANLVVLSESVLDYLSLDRIRRTIGQPNPIEAANQLQNLLPKTGQQPFAGIVIRLITTPGVKIRENLPELITVKSPRPILGTHRVSNAPPQPSQIKTFLDQVVPFARQLKRQNAKFKIPMIRARLALIVASLLVIIFLQSLVIIGKWRDYSARSTDQRVAFVTVETLLTEANTALLTQDTKFAAERLSLAREKLMALAPQDQRKLLVPLEENEKKLTELVLAKQKPKK